MADHGNQFIARIQGGDAVLSLDETRGVLFAARVRRRLEETVPATTLLHMADGETIETTPRQQFMTAKGWFLRASELKAGFRLKTHDKQAVEVVRVNHRTEATLVHTLELHNGGNYHVGRAGFVTRVKKRLEEPRLASPSTPELETRRARPKRPEIGPQPPGKTRVRRKTGAPRKKRPPRGT
jgi:hypothetical protein